MKKELLIAEGLVSLFNNNIKKNKKRTVTFTTPGFNNKNVDYFDEKTDINHLVMSGGGLAGTQYVYFLSELEKKYDLKNKNILNYVDMISSNSIGSILTFAYLLGYSSDELKKIIDEITLKIFKKNTIIIPFETTLKLTGTLGSFYDSNALKELIKKYLKESPLNKTIKRYNIGLDELTYENFTLDVLKKIYPDKIFNFLTFNLNKSRIEIFTNTDIFDRIEEEIKDLNFNLKGINTDISNILKSDSTISFNDCFVKSSVSKVVDVVMASAAVPFFFESIEIESLCEGKLEKNYYADGLITGGNIPILLGNKLIELIINKKDNDKLYNVNNMIIEVKSEVNEKYKPKNGLSSIFEFIALAISTGTGYYTKILSYDQLAEKIRFNNRYFGVKYDGFVLSYKQFEKNRDQYLKDKEN